MRTAGGRSGARTGEGTTAAAIPAERMAAAYSQRECRRVRQWGGQGERTGEELRNLSPVPRGHTGIGKRRRYRASCRPDAMPLPVADRWESYRPLTAGNRTMRNSVTCWALRRGKGTDKVSSHNASCQKRGTAERTGGRHCRCENAGGRPLLRHCNSGRPLASAGGRPAVAALPTARTGTMRPTGEMLCRQGENVPHFSCGSGGSIVTAMSQRVCDDGSDPTR
jgi:hypothetical protein